MSAEVLRKAAMLMRARAKAATPGPWWGRGVWWEHWTDPEGRLCHTPFPLVGHGHAGSEVVARVASSNEDRHHIASWHPDVALAVADLLELVADAVASCADADHFVSTNPTARRALAVARAYLGESS